MMTYASETSSSGTPLIFAMACATWDIHAGSFLPFTIIPGVHFSFLTALTSGGASVKNAADVCDGLISH